MEQEWNKLKRLSPRQRLGYIWDYYKLWIIGIAAFLLFAWYMTVNFLHGNRENYLYIEYVNTFADIGQHSDFWDGYVQKVQVDTDQVNVTFDAENYFDMTQKSVNGNHYYEKTVVLADSETLDAIVMEPDELMLMGQTGRLIDLNNEKTQHLMEKYQDKLITIQYTEENGDSREIPIGFDLSDSRLTEEAYEMCALGISACAQNIDAVEQFLDYVFEKG